MNHAHAHTHSHPTSSNLFGVAIIIVLIYACIEAFVGWRAQSLALLGDAGHMVSDAFALGIAAFAAWIANKSPSDTHSYGMGRAEVIASWISSLIILAISLGIIIEAVKRLHAPTVVHGVPVMITAFIGMLVNLGIAALLSKGERTLNIRAALLHVMSDLLGSFAALVAGAVIYYTGFFPIDPILSIFIGILITLSSFRILRESLHILMEGVPAHINLDNVSTQLSRVPGVQAIHDLHIWTLSSGSISLSAHVDIHDIAQWETILKNLTQLLESEYHIHHVTLQPEAEVFNCKPCN